MSIHLSAEIKLPFAFEETFFFIWWAVSLLFAKQIRLRISASRMYSCYVQKHFQENFTQWSLMLKADFPSIRFSSVPFYV